MGSPYLLPFLWAYYIIIQGLFRLPNYPIRQFCTAGGNGMYRDCIALAIFSDWWATMETASGPEVRGTSFRAIPLSIKIIPTSVIFWHVSYLHSILTRVQWIILLALYIVRRQTYKKKMHEVLASCLMFFFKFTQSLWLASPVVLYHRR